MKTMPENKIENEIRIRWKEQDILEYLNENEPFRTKVKELLLEDPEPCNPNQMVRKGRIEHDKSMDLYALKTTPRRISSDGNLIVNSDIAQKFEEQERNAGVAQVGA